MQREDILKKVNEVFKDIFDDESIVVTDETTANDIEEWDSLTHINLIASIEDTFKIKFSLADVVSFKKVGDMIDKIDEKLS